MVAGIRRSVPRAAPLLLVLLGLLSGCHRENEYVAPPPPEVVVTVPDERPVTLYHDYTGTTAASDSVPIRSRVTGYLESIHFQEGATIPKGQLLFVIDRRPFAAQLDQAKAELAARKATVTQLASIYKRNLALLISRAITPEQVDIDRGNYEVAQANVLQSEATVRQAQLNLDYAEIHAPIDGRIARHLVDVGSLVTADTTLLTTVVRYDPMYVYFNASETNYLAFLKRQRAAMQASAAKDGGAAKQDPGAPPPGQALELGLANENGYPHRGRIDFAEPTIDPNTGTRLIRGVFENPAPYFLAPGLFARVRVPIGTQQHALLIPDRAIGTDQAGDYVMVVGTDDVAQRRDVKSGPREGPMRVIDEGLKPGERLIVEGLQRARPGAEVKPVEARPQDGVQVASTQRRASANVTPQAGTGQPQPAEPSSKSPPGKPSQVVPPQTNSPQSGRNSK